MIPALWHARTLEPALEAARGDADFSSVEGLRVPLLGLRVTPDPFFDQIITALRDAGCPFPGAAA